MSGMQRRKGATYEREVASVINAELGLDIGRKLGQARDGGNDLDFGPFAVECKRRKTLGTVYGWLRQCIAAVLQRENPSDFIPIVIGREDNGTSIVIVGLHDFLKLVKQLVDANLINVEEPTEERIAFDAVNRARRGRGLPALVWEN